MKKFYIMLISLIILTTNSYCQNLQKDEGEITKVTDKPYLDPSLLPKSEQDKVKDKKILKQIGISTNNDKIIIEPKKTEEFLKNMAKTLEQMAKEFEGKTKDIKSSDIGIKTSKDKITIDLNKTKNFLDTFSKELENISKNIDLQ